MREREGGGGGRGGEAARKHSHEIIKVYISCRRFC